MTDEPEKSRLGLWLAFAGTVLAALVLRSVEGRTAVFDVVVREGR